MATVDDEIDAATGEHEATVLPGSADAFAGPVESPSALGPAPTPR
jgi:hypothetical protein